MKKMTVFVLTAMMMVSMAACGTKQDETIVGSDPATWGPEIDSEVEVISDGEQIPSPIIEMDSLEAAAEKAGFELTVPEMPEGYTDTVYSVVDLDTPMIQVDYFSDNDDLTIRKESFGSDGEMDISGVYTDYEETLVVEVDGISITMRGENERIYVATWAANDYNYSVSSTEGMMQEQAETIIGQIR